MARSRKRRIRIRIRRRRPRPLLRALLAAGLLATALAAVAGTYLYHSYSALVDERLHGERERPIPRVFARPLELRRGQLLPEREIIARLNDLGYVQRARPSEPGEFGRLRDAVALVPRSGPHAGTVVRITLAGRSAEGASIGAIDAGERAIDNLRLEPPLLTTFATGAREKRRYVPLAAIPLHVRQAVLAIEDQTFYSHPGVNPLRLAAAAVTNLRSPDRPPVGNSTITQQLARMFFQAEAFNAELRSGTRSYARYVQGALMSIVLERRATKDEILEMYLNDVYLGQRGSFAIHGVPEGARIFFGKDVANLTLAEAALIAGVIQSPATRSPFTHPARAVERRGVVLGAMAAEGYITADEAERAAREPLRVAPRAVDEGAPYFVDMVRAQLTRRLPELTTRPVAMDVRTTLDAGLQRAAIEAVRAGLSRVDEQLARRRAQGQPQAALVAVDPATGDVLAMVGGRSYNASQFNRATSARRQPGSVFKPFVFLAAFELAAADGRTDLTPASITYDEPRVLDVDGRTWEPQNYDDYDGAITWRRALARSRNLGTIYVGEQIGFDRIAALWRKVGVGTPPSGVPAITLGVFELTPLEVAQAYTLFVNGGVVRPLRVIDRVEAEGRTIHPPDEGRPVRVARADTTFLVTHMLRGVLDEGTGAGARAAGFRRDAAGKTGTTNDLRDAWFVGFTPDLLTVVWVGYDDNRPLGLTGSQAALPIWTEFMRRATAGRPDATFAAPDGVTFALVDRETGFAARPTCPGTIQEAFLAGTEPVELCPLH